MARIRRVLASVSCILATAMTSSAHGPEQNALGTASTKLGVPTLRSLQIAGFGAVHTVGQSAAPGGKWPRVQLKTYDLAIDYGASAMRIDMALQMGMYPPRGGGVAFVGERRQILGLSGTRAWSLQITPPTKADQATLQTDVSGAPPTVSRPIHEGDVAALDRRLFLFSTPHGFVRAALAGHASLRSAEGGTEASLMLDGRYPISGVIAPNGEVLSVRTTIPDAVMGDMVIAMRYSDYRPVPGGFRFPRRIVQTQGGQVSLDLWLSTVTANSPVDVSAPDLSPRTDAPSAVDVSRLGRGVFRLAGGSHHSVAVEMSEYVVLIEAPQNEARSRALIAAVAAAMPGKPIRYVVNTHHHFDHAGGLRAFVDAGAVVVTTDVNRTFFERVWSSPRTLEPDALSRSSKKPRFETFADSHILSDGDRRIELYRMHGSTHADGLAIVYLPDEYLIVQADLFTPPEKEIAAPEVPSPGAVTLQANLRRLKLKVAGVASLHGRNVVTLSDLAKLSGHQEFW